MTKEIKILAAIAVVIIIGAVIGARFYRQSVQSERVGAGGDRAASVLSEMLVRDDSPTLGAANAPVTVVEFLDPECESCAAFAPAVKKILKDYDGKVRLVTRYMPLHPNSVKAANLMEVAGEYEKYWQMQELLFQKQPEWGTKHGPPSSTAKPDVDALFEKYAMELGLDLTRVNEAIKQNRFQEKIERDRRDGQALGVRQTPTFFVNGRKLARFGEADLRALIDEELKR